MLGKNTGLVMITGSSVPILTDKIGRLLKNPVHKTASCFANGEIMIAIPVPVRDKHVIIIQSTSPPVNDNIMELLLMIDAARRGSAREISVLIPHFGYSRQDRKDNPRVPISAALVADMIEHAGADRIITLDIHSDQQQGFVKCPWDNLYASHTLLPVIAAMRLKNLVIASPDKGGVARANAYAIRLKADGIAIVYKERDTKVKNSSQALDLVGEVKGKNVVLIDDILDTAGTMVNASVLLKKRGAEKVVLAATHGLFSADALSRINTPAIDKIIITDTIAPRAEVARHPKIEICSVAPLLTEVIKRTCMGKSLRQGLID